MGNRRQIELRQLEPRQATRNRPDDLAAGLELHDIVFIAVDVPVLEVDAALVAGNLVDAFAGIEQHALTLADRVQRGAVQFPVVGLAFFLQLFEPERDLFELLPTGQHFFAAHLGIDRQRLVFLLGGDVPVLQVVDVLGLDGVVHQRDSGFLVADLIQPDRFVFRKTEQPGEYGGDHHRDQHGRVFRFVVPHGPHGAQRDQGHAQRRPVRVLHRGPERVDHELVVVLALVRAHAEQLAQLRGRDDDGRGVDETDHHGVRQEVEQHTEPEHAQGQLEQPDHEGQQDGVCDEGLAARCRQGLQRGGGHQGNHGHRPGRELPGRTEQRGDDGRQQ